MWPPDRDAWPYLQFQLAPTRDKVVFHDRNIQIEHNFDFSVEYMTNQPVEMINFQPDVAQLEK